MDNQKYRIRLRRRNIPETEILEDIGSVAHELKLKSLTRIQYDERGAFGASTVIRKFGSWNKALVAAGLKVKNRQDISNDELFENLIEVWTKLGRQPFGKEMSNKSKGSKFSSGTYEKRFGSWNGALLAFAEYLDTPVTTLPNDTLEDTKPNVMKKRTARDVNWRLRAKILIRDNCICQMCGDSPAKTPECLLHVDHILAWSNGGETTEENLQTLCAVCNIGKSNAF
ncbi:homing endonuclease associated repeat-containing protein [Parasphingorhabdus halotolerans]|uniref:HNH endonuclease n=1 Tax=Parasphingorhabdus halotolerans TaxID=2725558 RepID=A0A6H2DKG9_9SPHN|nr:HNH endonuclease [Parasphingorhabdus halotolerans]QJB68483.1 HNH endonuclease [Parasphingorhabdus halotolerans]